MKPHPLNVDVVTRTGRSPIVVMASPETEFSDSELHDSLVKWLENCLALGGTLTFDPGAVNDGVATANCLVQLAPDFFSPEWRSKIISETGGNWKLKQNNLKKILRGVLDYYHQVLHLSLDKFSFPDVSKIAESSSQPDTAKLLQLVLGIAINCEQKETYIQAIMSMQQEVQHVVMGAIQDLMKYESPSMVTGEDYKMLEEQHKQTAEQLHSAHGEKEQLLQANHELQVQLKGTQEQLEELNNEVKLLRIRLKEAQATVGVSSEGKMLQFQRQLETVKMEKLKLETERDDLKHRLEATETQVQELFQKNHTLQIENEEIPILRDSLEEMKYLESKVKSYESVISQYKKKLEDAQQLRKQLKAMEDKNMTYMQQNLDLEEELRRLSGLRTQMDAHKQRLQDLENELAQEKLRCLEATQDGEEKSQLLDSLRAELSQVKRERDKLSALVPGTPSGESLGMLSFQSSHAVPPSPSLDQPDAGSFGLLEAFTPELREKMARLEKENEILHRRLETEAESPLPGTTSSSGGGGDGLRKKVAEQAVTIERLEREMVEKRHRLSQVELAAKEFKSQVVSLEEVRKVKDVEIEKYKKYLNKAKKIIESFGEGKSRAAEDSLEIQSLRNQLKEKEKTTERLEREYSQDKLAWEREEKLVVSAWYEMGLMMHRKYSQERLQSPHGSFLAQQRQALYKRPVPINTSITTSISTSPATSVAGET